MIAPGLPEIARAFGVTNPTVAALTLSIFVLAYVRNRFIILSIFRLTFMLGHWSAFHQPALRE